MGCYASRLDDEEAVQICRDRKNFIKQAIEQRNRFAYGHVAYLDSLKRVCKALLDHVEGEHHEILHFHATSSLRSAKRLSPEMLAIHSNSSTLEQYRAEKGTSHTINYSRSGANPSISIEEWPESSETMRVESYYPTHNRSIDGFFNTNAPVTSSSSFFSSDHNGSNFQPATPQASHWDFFWDPFTSINNFRYPSQNNPDPLILDDENERMRKVREEEGIPELEEDNEDHRKDGEKSYVSELKDDVSNAHLKGKNQSVPSKDTINVQKKPEKVENIKELKSSKGRRSSAEANNAAEHAVNHDHAVMENRSSIEERPGFTVYLERRPMSIGEVMRDVETQFIRICDSAKEVAVKLEVTGASGPSTSEDVRMFNPAALFRTTSSRSSSSRSLQASNITDDGCETSSANAEEASIVFETHKSTLDRLYLWEKKQLQEVKSGERVRIAYEKKCMLLRSQDENGAEPSIVGRTRAVIRDLQTQLNVSINAVEYVSKRIETIRDQELHPQLVELIKSLSRMWRAMAECHRIQKRSVEEGKHLFSSSSSTAAVPFAPPTLRSSRSAETLEAALRNWGSCLAAWIHAQRSYARALAGWIRRCAPAQPDATGAPSPSPLLTPNRSRGGGGAPPLYGVCVRWTRLLDTVSEAAAIEGVEFFAAGVASVAAAEKKEAAAEDAAAMAADVGPKVVCAGLAMAVGALAEFTANSAAAYEEFVRSLEESEMVGRGILN